jgi:phage portal protein BeeE
MNMPSLGNRLKQAYNVFTGKYDFAPYNDKGGVIMFSGFGDTGDFSNIKTAEGQASAYQLVHAVRTVINRCSTPFGNGEVWVLDKNGNEVKTREATEAAALLKNPNPTQTWVEFYVQQNIYKRVFGYCPVYAVRPVGLRMVAALYNVLPLIFSVEYTGKLYNQTSIADIVKSYRIAHNGVSMELPIEDVYINRDDTASMDTVELLPDSRLCSLRYESALALSLSDAKYAIVARRGALGILTNETHDAVGSVPLSPEEKKDVQEDYSRYGLSTQKNQIVISSANLRWQQIGLGVRDLMLNEQGEDVKMQLADAYDYPYEMLGSTRGVTFANKNEAKKQFYNDTVIPSAKKDSEALTKFLGLENCRVDISFSKVPALQADKKQQAETLSTTIAALGSAYREGAISMEEYRKELSNLIDIDPGVIPEKPDTQNEQQPKDTGKAGGKQAD